MLRLGWFVADTKVVLYSLMPCKSPRHYSFDSFVNYKWIVCYQLDSYMYFLPNYRRFTDSSENITNFSYLSKDLKWLTQVSLLVLGRLWSPKVITNDKTQISYFEYKGIFWEFLNEFLYIRA